MPSKSDSILGHPWQTNFRGKLKRGISSLVAEVFARNSGMLKAISSTSWPMAKSVVDGTVHVTLSLKDAPAG